MLHSFNCGHHSCMDDHLGLFMFILTPANTWAKQLQGRIPVAGMQTSTRGVVNMPLWQW